ncbi:hypothetical protein [Mitsuokella sp.]|uniref:hypothetical protein n=1 Tax=Mitsuokella sp. TaxID=2049034 RepID=UPI003D7DFFF3
MASKKYLDLDGLKYVVEKIYHELYETDDIFFELDKDGNMMPLEHIPAKTRFEKDANGDLQPIVTTLSSDNYELDSNNDIMPKA